MSGQPRSSAPWVGLILLVGLLGAGFVFLGLPRLQAERRNRNESEAIRALVGLVEIQREFRRKDPDKNGVSDYWTGDVAGLLQFGLIDRGLAEADAKPLAPLCPRPVPWNGYFCVALKVHSPQGPIDKSSPFPPAEWAVCFYPAEPGRTGKHMYLYISGWSHFRSDATLMPPPKVLPSDEEFKAYWSKYD